EGIRGLPEAQKHDHWKVEKVLAGLGFSEQDLQRHPLEFSGGFQVRLNLAKVLVSEPDLLLLDEPTNYLDITSIRWIERFLISWPHELMLITHDRTFMDKIVTHIIGIHRTKVRRIPGSTEKYFSQIALDEEVYEKTRLNDERRRKEVELFISRFRAKARLATLVQSRVKALEKMEKRDKIAQIKTLDFSFRNKPFSGKYMLTAKNISFGYDPGSPLIKNFSISIDARDRVCLVGKNGKGKTTLLKVLARALRAQAGEITYNPNVTEGFFEQTNVKSLIETRTVEQEILYSHPDVDSQMARAICGAMMFEGDAALKKVGVISGGEKSRVMLGKLLATPLNLLLLDEPTNHLDMDSSDALLAAIDSFKGAVVMVTHNELLLHALAERLIVFQDESPCVFEGDYQRFLEKVGWGDEELQALPAKKTSTQEQQGEKRTKKNLRRIRSDFFTERSRVLRPLEERIALVEHEIDAHEQQLKACYNEMQEASQQQNGPLIARLSQAMHSCQTTIDRLFDELETLTASFDGQKELFDRKLEEIENKLSAFQADGSVA
ncbi:MAG: ATP-binding cassette domain-containing protein, partial [Pseudomonadota bacterium]